MGFFGKPKQYVRYPSLDPKKPNRTDIVGESFNQDALTRMARFPMKANTNYLVTLVPEPENPYDKHAIRVDWLRPDGRGALACGHIAKEETADWHQRLASIPDRTVWVWPAYLMGGMPGEYFGLYFEW